MGMWGREFLRERAKGQQPGRSMAGGSEGQRGVGGAGQCGWSSVGERELRSESTENKTKHGFAKGFHFETGSHWRVLSVQRGL